MSWETVFVGDFGADDVQAYGRLVAQLQRVHDAIAAMPMHRASIDALTADLEQWAERLEPMAVEEQQQVNGRAHELPSRGHALVPPLAFSSADRDRAVATVRFGRWFMGGGMAAHGGAVALVFDEVLGFMAGMHTGEGMRTAYLHTDYRALTPIDTDLDVTAWVERQEGRKVFVRAELRHGAALCAEANGLFLQLLPDQGVGKRADPGGGPT